MVTFVPRTETTQLSSEGKVSALPFSPVILRLYCIVEGQANILDTQRPQTPNPMLAAAISALLVLSNPMLAAQS